VLPVQSKLYMFEGNRGRSLRFWVRCGATVWTCWLVVDYVRERERKKEKMLKKSFTFSLMRIATNIASV